MTVPILETLLGVFTGVTLKILYDEFKQPKLEIERDKAKLEYFAIGKDGMACFVCRIFVHNRKKFAMNSVATDCIAWLCRVKDETKQQTSWVRNHDVIAINPDDYQKVNLFTIFNGANYIQFGSETDPLMFKTGLEPPLSFIIKITCSNGKGDSVLFNLKSIDWSKFKLDDLPHSNFIDVDINNS